ncbi:hypothetical protein [Amycolatopsis sp. CA-128772]|uniref:hypothetical protein n=1 Tax=Amycolatopsis sp. CA-128772 TaxID=2073159 RepID=UPI000CD1EF05|nr:hypothetical protein [Amycolatopsis sp. CA-128772]
MSRHRPGVRLFGLGHGRKPSVPAFGARNSTTFDVAGHDRNLGPGTGSFADLTRITAGPPTSGS